MEDEREPTGRESENGPDEALLREIRDRYAYMLDKWSDAREHRAKLMRYLCGDPWDPADRKARAKNGRPCISHDELNQYVNQCVNAARQNKRGIKIEPAGNGANDKTAELREDIARTIEYRSRAQSIYLKAYQDEVEGGYGFCRVTRRYLSNDSDDQEIIIKAIPNPDSVLYDPDCKEPDWCDAADCFVLEPITRSAFKRKYPEARITDFATEHMLAAPGWITDQTVLIAEYWKVETTQRKGKTGRMVEDKTLMQYITNGVEILERLKQPGEEIPIPAFIGMERYVDDGGTSKRKLFALPSFALDPQMSLAYFVSQEAEEAGMTPKSPYIGYAGQFETDRVAWENLTKIPRAFVQVDPVPDQTNGGLLPLPQRVQFTPNFAAYEVAIESTRRAIRAAMGNSPLPTAAARQNQKSGVALDKIKAEEEIGSFHFVDGYERALIRTGRIVNSWIPVTYDTEREIGLHKRDESRRVVKLNTDKPYTPEGKQESVQYVIGEEGHDVTLGTGPSADSQRDAASQFLDLLVGNLENIPVAPPQKAKLLSLAIQMKELGPKGDEMAEIISPDDAQQLPPAAQAAIGEAKQKIQAMNAYAQQLEGEIQKLQMEKQAKVIDNAAKADIEKMRIEADITKAEIMTKAQSIEERVSFIEDAWKQLHSQAHDAGLQAQDQAHARDLQESQQEAAQAQAQQEQQAAPEQVQQ